MHYLVTGHTGFKGAWMVLLLKSRGHEVSGISLDPLPGGLFELGKVSEHLKHDFRLDIRDAEKLADALQVVNPDVLIHMAAQPLVRYSYLHPRETFETNVNGTLNVLEASQKLSNLKARLIITTDKVYRNVNQVEGYVEEDALGGDDPYSSSKAMADILTQSWVKSFPAMPTAVARAGNVIGGGDVSPDRLIPDSIRAFTKRQPVSIRYPKAVRPWQHVLDCVNGYLALVDMLLKGEGLGEWNFGPGPESFVEVGAVVEQAREFWGDGASVEVAGGEHLHEANLLALDSTKSLNNLGWSNRLVYPSSLKWTIEWEQKLFEGMSAIDITQQQLRQFDALA